MKRAAVLASVVLSLTAHSELRADSKLAHAQKKSSTRMAEAKRGPVIHVTQGGWGNASPADIELLLGAVTSELLRHFPGRQLDPIVVSHSSQGPIVLYQKGPQNEYRIHLAANGERWAEYVYEFSHELLHILANYENHARGEHATHLWFEEMLGEAASLHMLKHFSLTWEQSPPLATQVSYAPVLTSFTQRALYDRRQRLPDNVSFEQWFLKHGPSLCTNPHLREKNALVANLFLPLLERTADWSAIAHLNLVGQPKTPSFYDFLAQWHGNTPPEHRGLVRDAIQFFHFERPADEPAT